MEEPDNFVIHDGMKSWKDSLDLRHTGSRHDIGTRRSHMIKPYVLNEIGAIARECAFRTPITHYTITASVVIQMLGLVVPVEFGQGAPACPPLQLLRFAFPFIARAASWVAFRQSREACAHRC